MALIPITFKNNDTPTVKSRIGKVTPAQQRLVNSYGLLDKVGIFNGYGGNCTAINTTISANTDNTFTINLNKGALSIYGGVAVVEQGTAVNIPNTISSGSFGIRVDLSKQAGNEMSFYYKAQSEGLVKNDLQDEETSGIYEFELYKYTISGSIMTLVSGTDLNKKLVTTSEYFAEKLGGINDYVVYSEKLPNGWFRKWKSGFKEYHVSIPTQANTTYLTCTFKEAFTDTNYLIDIKAVRTLATPVTDFSGYVTYDNFHGINGLPFNKQTTSFNFHVVSGQLNYNIYVAGF